MREQLSPLAAVSCGRGRGDAQAGRIQPVRPRAPRPLTSSTARSRGGFLSLVERIEANRSARSARQFRDLGEVRLAAVCVPSCPAWWSADSLAGSTGPQLLYQVIGAGNLRAYADTEAVGHAALANLAVGSTP